MEADRRSKILVVAEEAQLRLSVISALSRHYECQEAASVEQAKEIFAPERDDIAVAVLCLRGLALAPLELARVIKQRSPTTKVIIITSFVALEATKTAVRERVCDAYLVRPFDLPDFRDVVMQAVNARDEEAKAMEKTESSG